MNTYSILGDLQKIVVHADDPDEACAIAHTRGLTVIWKVRLMPHVH